MTASTTFLEAIHAEDQGHPRLAEGLRWLAEMKCFPLAAGDKSRDGVTWAWLGCS